jgi:hypothetical protein
VVALLRKAGLFTLGLSVLLLPTAALRFFAADRSTEEPLEVARSYLKATHARDYAAAYRFISSADRIILDQESYLQAQVALRGFASQLAKQLARDIEIQVIERETKDDRARLTIDYKLPAADELSALLYNWDEDKLNALSYAEQQRIFAALETMKKARNVITTEGRETFTLVKEGSHWKIFLDWASGIKVSFDAAVPPNDAFEVEVLRRTLFAGMDEPFQTSLKLRNRGQRELVARIDHRIEPKEVADRIAMIACGFLRPLTLEPGEEREVSSAYLLEAGFPRNTALSITFKFNLANGRRAGSLGKKAARGAPTVAFQPILAP